MPRLFFDIRDCTGLHRDEHGDEFDDIDGARQQAQAILSLMIGEDLPDGELHQISCGVRDEAGRVVYQGDLTFRGKALPVA